MESNIPKDNLNSLIKNTPNDNSINGTFIKVDGDRIINTNMIKTIHIYPSQYHIELLNNGGSGSYGIIVAGTGWLARSDNNDSINIFKDTSQKEYEDLTNLIAKMSDDN